MALLFFSVLFSMGSQQRALAEIKSEFNAKRVMWLAEQETDTDMPEKEVEEVAEEEVATEDFFF